MDDDARGKRRRGLVILAIAIVGVVGVVGFSGQASTEIDRRSSHLQAELRVAFDQTTRRDVRALEERASLGGDEEERALSDFLDSTGEYPFVFRRSGPDYVARWRVRTWGQERLIEVRWSDDTVTVEEL
jgi:hypothetical protein